MFTRLKLAASTGPAGTNGFSRLWSIRLEKGSLLRQLAQQQGKRSAVDLFGSLKNRAQRLLESLRYWHWPEEAFELAGAGSIQIRLDSS